MQLLSRFCFVFSSETRDMWNSGFCYCFCQLVILHVCSQLYWNLHDDRKSGLWREWGFFIALACPMNTRNILYHRFLYCQVHFDEPIPVPEDQKNPEIQQQRAGEQLNQLIAVDDSYRKFIFQCFCGSSSTAQPVSELSDWTNLSAFQWVIVECKLSCLTTWKLWYPL